MGQNGLFCPQPHHFDALERSGSRKRAGLHVPNLKLMDSGSSYSILSEIIKNAGTIIWNGPVGVFEMEAFGGGTEQLAQDIANNQGFSIAGGGDTLAAIDKYGIGDQVSYISTGGGAFLEFVEGKTLPAVAVLQKRFREVN